MTTRLTLWLTVSTFALAVWSGPGCASGGAGRAASTPQESREPSLADSASHAAGAGHRTVGEESGVPESAGVSDSTAVDIQQATPSTTPDGRPEPSATWSPSSSIGEVYAMQNAEIGALGTALDASDCATAAQLGDAICRLAARVCDLGPDDARCDEARGSCARARSRISTRCGGR